MGEVARLGQARGYDPLASRGIPAPIYRREDEIHEQGSSPEQVLAHRGEYVKPLVDGYFEDLRAAMGEEVFLPTNPFTKAARCALEREEALRVFLQYPDVALDTNHVERAIRPTAIGRKNWLSCWTGVGAHCVGILQSLLSTCRTQVSIRTSTWSTCCSGSTPIRPGMSRCSPRGCGKSTSQPTHWARTSTGSTESRTPSADRLRCADLDEVYDPARLNQAA